MDTQTEYIEAALKAISAEYRNQEGKRGRTIFCGVGGKDPAAFNIKIMENGRVRIWTYLTKELWAGAADDFRKMHYQDKTEARIGMKVTRDGALAYYYEEKLRTHGIPYPPCGGPAFEGILKEFLCFLDGFQICLVAREIPLLHERLNLCEDCIFPGTETAPGRNGNICTWNRTGPGNLFVQLKEAFAGVLGKASANG